MKTLSRGPSFLQEWFLLDGGESPSARHWWVPVSYAGPRDSEALLGRPTPGCRTRESRSSWRVRRGGITVELLNEMWITPDFIHFFLCVKDDKGRGAEL